MRSALARPALLAALALVLGACSADRPLAPAPPSLAGATPTYQEPTPIPDTAWTCMRFDTVPVGRRWGASAGTPKGATVLQENDIAMSLTDYLPASGPAQYRDAVIDTARYPDVLNKHALRLDTVGVVFDFTGVAFTIGTVVFNFADRSPLENLAVDGSAVYLGQVVDWPTLPVRNMIGHNVIVQTLFGLPVRGEVRIYGDLDYVRVGGSNDPPVPSTDVTGLWLDNVCVYKAMIPADQQVPHPV